MNEAERRVEDYYKRHSNGQFGNSNHVYVFTQGKGGFAFGIGWNLTLHNQPYRFRHTSTMQFDKYVWEELERDFAKSSIDGQGTEIWERKVPYEHDTEEDIENSLCRMEEVVSERKAKVKIHSVPVVRAPRE